jgi:DNA adenine methylase
MGPILKYPGSKWKLAKWIISYFPEHETYLEPYFGSGAVLLNKQPSKVETVNDINSDIVNLFKVIREQPEELIKLVEFTPWSREEYKNSYIKTDNPLENARRFLVRCWQGYGTDISHKVGWCNVKRNTKLEHLLWNKLPERISYVVERLKNVQIENKPALDVIKDYNYPHVLIYADPPYLLETRSGGKRYTQEMTKEEHIELLNVLKQHTGYVILSGYPNKLYDEILKDWKCYTHNNVAVSGKKCVECIWIKPQI